MKFRISVLFLILVSAACAPAATPVQPTVTLPPPEGLPTNSPAPTALPSATPDPTTPPIPSATWTLLPTETPPPTVTPLPTRTPIPEATPVPTVTSPPPATAAVAFVTVPIGEAPAHEGQVVTVSGQVVQVSSFAGGFKFVLVGENGRLTLLLWHNVYDDCWDAPRLNLGATVRATGEVGQYEGEWQLVPRFGGDVKVSGAAGATAPHAPIGDLGAHLDERVMISGSIGRVQGSGAGVTLFVTDESGEVAVFVWQNILDRIPDNTALGTPGTQVRVTGRVSLYRSNRQVVPALPYDVEVMP